MTKENVEVLCDKGYINAWKGSENKGGTETLTKNISPPSVGKDKVKEEDSHIIINLIYFKVPRI